MAAITTAASPGTADSSGRMMDEISQHPLQIIYNSLSTLTDIATVCQRPWESLTLLQVMSLMPLVQLHHLGIPSSAVGKLKHAISMKVAEKLDMFDIAAFVLPRGFTIHLHDHPNMTVCSKLLRGEVHIRSFSRLRRHYSDPPTPSNSESKLSDETIECQLTVSERKTAADDPWYLTPDDGNFHEITAVTDSVLLDILLPPYDDHDRNCTFYEPTEQVSGAWTLTPIPEDLLRHRQKGPVPVPYKGYRPFNM